MTDSLCRPASSARRISWRILTAAVSASIAVSLAACESPLGPGYGSAGYADSLLARSLTDDSYSREIAHMPTITAGVRELYPRAESARVDSVGPTTAVAVDPVSTTQPGLRAAQLNQNEPTINLSLQDAIARAVQHSLAIKVEAYNPAIKELQVFEAQSIYDPTVFGSSQYARNDDPQLTPGASFSNGTSWVNQLGIRTLLPTGAQIQVSSGVTYRDLPDGLFLNPGLNNSNYQANINAQVSQPLLRGFGTDVTDASIYLAQRDQRISLAVFRRQVISTVADVEEAYYVLVQAKTNVDILERLVRASQQTWELVKLREPLDATMASINQALSALQSRRADLLVAQKTYRAASDQLKNLLNDPELDIRDSALIVPTDKPIAEPIYYSTAESIELALRQRTELQEARLQVERADIIVRVAKNDLLPKVDLVAGLQTNGLDSRFDDAFSNTVDPMNSLDFSAGIKFEFQLGNLGPRSALSRREKERRQAVTQMIRVAQDVVTEVKKQLRELLSSYDEIQLRDSARVASSLEFEGIIKIEQLRPKTPEFLQLKLDSQARLAGAEQALVQSIVNYNIAIMRLEQAKGTLLEFNRISLDRPPVARETDNFRRNWLKSTKFTK